MKLLPKPEGRVRLVVVLEQLNPFQAPEVIGKLARALEKVPGTHFVDSKIPEEFLNHRQTPVNAPKTESASAWNPWSRKRLTMPGVSSAGFSGKMNCSIRPSFKRLLISYRYLRKY